MLKEQEHRLSKLMTKILRHTPESFGIRLDPSDGSCELDVLLRTIRRLPKLNEVTKAQIEQVVSNSDKQRFEIADGRIRARYGHSSVRVVYAPGMPPKVLYHGTNRLAAPDILREGIKPLHRQYVHMSEGLDFASLAGSRRGDLEILVVDTVLAGELGVTFYFAGNEVWLADFVPAECCRVYEGR